jgi:hypothetical protein
MSDEVDFICGCPGKGCTNERGDIKWKHRACGCYEKINDEGIVRCLNSSNCLECPIVCLQFKCGVHDDYKEFDAQQAYRIIGQISNLNLSGVGKQFIRNLRKAIDIQLDSYGL